MSSEKRKLAARISMDNSGKIPPQAIDMEEAVLGAILLDKTVMKDVRSFLNFKMFYKESHLLTFKAMQELDDGKNPIDMLTVVQQLRKNGHLDLAGGPLEIHNLTRRMASAANVEYHGRIVLQKFLQRELIRVSGETIREAYEDACDPLESIDILGLKITGLVNQISQNKIVTLSDAYDSAVVQINSTEDKETDLLICNFHLPSVNEHAVGKTRGNNTIIAARPGVGKTAFVVQELYEDSFTVPVGLVTIEQTTDELMYRMISSQTGIPTSKLLRRKSLSAAERNIIGELKEHFKKRFFIVDNVKTLPAIKNSLIKLFEVYGVEVWGLDYLQLAKHESIYKTKNNTIEEISGELKHLSKDYKKHGLILSQLGRESDKGAEIRKPRMSDLRDSGAIEQDATTIFLLYRPEAQGVMQTKDGADVRGLAKIIIAKNRLGAPAKEVDVLFDGIRYKFYEEEQLQSSLSFNQEEDTPY